MHPLDRQKYAAEDIALVFDGRTSAESDYRILASSGEWRWVNVRTRVVERNAAGKALRIVGACIMSMHGGVPNRHCAHKR